eukprot:5197457-Prorocentrum_lima.AAC.1
MRTCSGSRPRRGARGEQGWDSLDEDERSDYISREYTAVVAQQAKRVGSLEGNPGYGRKPRHHA